MSFKKKSEFDNSIDKAETITYRQPEIKKVMEDNAEQICWKDVLALTIAGMQVLAPRVLIFILSYLLLGYLFVRFIAN